MAGTAFPYTGANIPQGPALVWFDCALPGAGATVTLHTDGTPDATANPSARFLGKLKTGAKFSYKPKINEFMTDEDTAAYRFAVDTEDVTLSGEWAEIQDSQLLLRMMTGGTRSAAAGYERVTGGGLTTFPTYVVMLVWAQPELLTKFVSLIIYKAANFEGVDFAITKKEPASSPFSLKGLAISTRAAGDTVFQINKQV